MTSTTIHNYYLACAGSDTMQFSTGIIPPVAAPAYPDRPAEYYNSVTQFLYRWDLGTQTWKPVPKVYREIITQAGTAAPTAVILENNLGGSLAWTRISNGRYRATATAAVFVANKFSLNLGPADLMAIPGKFYLFSITSATELDIYSSTTSTLTDALLNKTSFQLLIFP